MGVSDQKIPQGKQTASAAKEPAQANAEEDELMARLNAL
jgi:hypothetical protein